MKYEDKQIKLKNGKTASLRAPIPEDAAKLLTYMKTVTDETHFLMNYPEEYVISVEDEAKILGALEASKTRLMILCEIDGSL